MNKNPILIIENVRSSHNVGSLFRTADAVGVGYIYLVGYTPAPVDKFGKVNSDIAKSALGGEKTIPWKKATSSTVLIKKLQKDNCVVVAIEQSVNAIDYKKVSALLKSKYKGKQIVFVLGNEVDGVSRKTLGIVDLITEIPMSGTKESLNVSVAGGIAMFRILGK